MIPVVVESSSSPPDTSSALGVSDITVTEDVPPLCTQRVRHYTRVSVAKENLLAVCIVD